jgi:hypothetical protein
MAAQVTRGTMRGRILRASRCPNFANAIPSATVPRSKRSVGACYAAGSEVVLGKKKPSVTEPREPLRVQRLRVPIAALVRMFFIGAVAVVACIWAIWRHYNVPPARMLVPGPAASHAPGDGAHEHEIEVDSERDP